MKMKLLPKARTADIVIQYAAVMKLYRRIAAPRPALNPFIRNDAEITKRMFIAEWIFINGRSASFSDKLDY